MVTLPVGVLLLQPSALKRAWKVIMLEALLLDFLNFPPIFTAATPKVPILNCAKRPFH